MRLFDFWQKWILVSGIIILLMGLSFPVMIYFNIELDYINKVFWPSKQIPVTVIPFKNWIFGSYSALAITFGTFIIFLAAIPFKRKEKWAWLCLFTCYSIWLLIDSIFSLNYKVFSNASNNFILYLILIIPLIFTKKILFRMNNVKTY